VRILQTENKTRLSAVWLPFTGRIPRNGSETTEDKSIRRQDNRDCIRMRITLAMEIRTSKAIIRAMIQQLPLLLTKF
jgi:hypothetical protein